MNNKAIAPETTVQERCAICGRPRIYKYDGYCRPSANDAPTEVAGHTFEAERRLAATNRAHAVVV